MTEAHTTVFTRRARKRTTRTGLPRPPRIGDVLGMYRLCVEIGSGGMASVYLARGCNRAGVHQFVALKCIRPELAQDPRFVDMFVDEARVASQIHHPNVCSVLDFDEYHGTHYLVMELLSGHTLTAVQHELGQLPDAGDAIRIPVFARILEAACEGLHAAHETLTSSGVRLDVVHRDVSPDNLFVTYDGNVKVMDFGVAHTSHDHHATRTGVVKGKCSYLAPELLVGDKPDRRTDIWGLGVVAWELIAQRKLFDQPFDPAILRAIAEMPIPPPSSVRAGVPKSLDEVVMHALERDPAKRYQTARELGRMLNRFLVEHCHVVSLAEISEFMCTLFPAGLACSRQLLRVAEQEAPPPRPRMSTAKGSAPTVADAERMLELARVSATPDATPTRAPSQTETRSSWRWSQLSMILALILVAAFTGAVVACRVTKVDASPPPAITLPADSTPPNFRLEATPVGNDTSGAVLLRVQLIRSNP